MLRRNKVILAVMRTAEARRLVFTQRQFIEGLKTTGSPTLDAQRTLMIYESSLGHLEAYEDKLRKERKNPETKSLESGPFSSAAGQTRLVLCFHREPSVPFHTWGTELRADDLAVAKGRSRQLAEHATLPPCFSSLWEAATPHGIITVRPGGHPICRKPPTRRAHSSTRGFSVASRPEP